jgi:cyclase
MRMRYPRTLTFGFTAIVSLSGLAMFATAQQPPAPLMVRQLKGDVYWAQGGAGGNSGIIIGQNGVIVVDAKTTPDSAKEMLAEIAKLTPKPVTHLILTHSDGDHVNGLAAFPKGITIIAHENNKKEQEAALAAGGRGAPPRDYLPTQLVTKNKESLKIDGVSITLLHWAAAHTSGDLVVYSSSEGWIQTTKGIAGLDADTFMPGHGDIQTKAEIQKRLADAEQKRAKIKQLVAQGKSVDEIRRAVGDPPPAAPGGRGPAFASFTEVVYQDLTKK